VASTEAATTRIGAYLEHPLTPRPPRAAVRAPPSSNASTRAERTSVEHAFPGVSEHALRGTDELGATCLLGGQADDDRGGVGERDARADSRPAGHWWALQAEAAEQAEDAAEEALNAGTFAQFVGGPGGRQTGPVLLAFGFQGTTATAPSTVWIQ
jgi:hypothetical protein